MIKKRRREDLMVTVFVVLTFVAFIGKELSIQKARLFHRGKKS